MRLTHVFEAYLDDYKTIAAYLSKSFYHGESECFQLRTEAGDYLTLSIVETDATDEGYTLYKLALQDELEVGRIYEVVDEHYKTCVLSYRLITKTERFIKEFVYYKDDLGPTYQPDKSVFKLWAPTARRVLVDLVSKDTRQVLEMKRTEGGVFELECWGDWELASYLYLIHVNGAWRQAIDPYGKALSVNSKRSVVIDLLKTRMDLCEDCLPAFTQRTDAVIYEASIRDFSSDPGNGIMHKGKFLGMIEDKTQTHNNVETGFAYLKKLGITHLQLMPVLDFKTVDEQRPDKFYNWGYDPVSYMVPEGSYAVDPDDPYTRILELKQLIARYHRAGIRVTLDVVFNHFYSIDDNMMEQIVPYYYLRYDKEAVASNGSYCENDVDSTQPMMAHYIKHASLYLMREFGVDGFRFDLMGLLDVDLIHGIAESCLRLKPEALIYGEGWNMPTLLADEEKAAIHNADRLKEVGFFNDYFRNILKGNSYGPNQGYLAGNIDLRQDSFNAFASSILKGMRGHLFNDPGQSINYLECHDNYTLWDKIALCCPHRSKAQRKRIHKLMLGALFTAQGVVFMHSGMEFCRTKQGIDNSYISPDSINRLDYQLAKQFQDVVNYVRDMIELRKEHPSFRLNDAEAIKKKVSFELLGDQALLYRISNGEDEFESVEVIFNPSTEVVYHTFNEDREILANEAGKVGDVYCRSATIAPLTMVVLGKRRYE